MALSFGASVRKNTEKMKRGVQTVCYKIVFELYNTIIQTTPVLKGDLINNWFTMPSGRYSKKTTDIHDKNGSGSFMNVKSLKQADLFYGRDSICTMTNNLPYAYRVEYLGWSRLKRPQGMVRVSLVSVAGKYK